MVKTSIITILFQCFASALSLFSIPPIKIETYSPRGFRISVLHVNGMQLFAFHANINQPLRNLEVGEYFKDVTQPTKEWWVYENRNTLLHKGDKIYYWVYVLHNKLGYRRDDQIYTVNELIRGPIPNLPSPESNDTPNSDLMLQPDLEDCTSTTETSTPSNDLQVCRATLQAVVQRLLSIESELNDSRQTQDILFSMLESQPNAKKLKLTGRISPTGDPAELVKFILREKLGLKPKIVSAKRNIADVSIDFEVSTVEEAVTIVKKAKEKLENSESVSITF